MRNIQIVHIQDDQRQRVVPVHAPGQLIGDGGNHAARGDDGPDPAQDPHVPVLVALVRLLVSRRRPQQLDAEETVLDGRQVGVRHDHHDVLHVEAVAGLGPEPEDDGAVDDGRDRKGQVVVLEPLGPEEEQEGSRDGRDEDSERHRGVVEETYNIPPTKKIISKNDMNFW